ncbi:hypothetical protein ACFODO_20665, partial [Acinetobacter sichuanensis]
MSSISVAEYKKLSGKPRRTKRRVVVKKGRVVSEGEAKLAQHLKSYKIEFQAEFQFNPERKWRADFYILGTKVLIEVE